MLGKINNVYQWSQEAQKYTAQGAGDELPHLDDQKSLVPFEENTSFWGIIFGRKVTRQAESFKTTCLELAEEADGLAEKIGIMDRIAKNQEEKDWEEMTIEQLAEGFDELLTTRSVQLLKAQKSLDELVACCHGYIHCDDDDYKGPYVSQPTLKLQFQDFPKALKEVFKQLNKINDKPEENLQQIKDLLQVDVQNALLKICFDNDHKNYDTAGSLANNISLVFDECMKTLKPGPLEENLEENLDDSVKGRIEQMLEDLKNPKKHGADLNERIRDLARVIVCEVDNSDDPEEMLRSIQDQCQKQLAQIVRNDSAMRQTVEPVQIELSTLEERYRKKPEPVKQQVQPPGPQTPPQRKSPTPTKHLEATTAKPAPANSLASFQQQIESLAQKPSDHQTRTECQRLMESIENYAQNSSLPPERALAEVNTLITWLQPVINDAKDRFVQEIMIDELLIRATGLHENLSPGKRQQASPQNISSKTRMPSLPGVPTQPRVVTEQELLEKRLISGHDEYLHLSKILPQGFLTHPNIVECLSALRNMQSFNRGISNQDFAHLANRWSPQKLLGWAQSMNNQSAGQAPYLGSSEDMRNALEEIGLAQNISPQMIVTISMLEINGLSVPHIFEQLRALDFLARTFPGESIPLNDIPYIIKHDILTPYLLEQIRSNQSDHSRLMSILKALKDDAGNHWDKANNGVENFNNRGISKKMHQSYGLEPRAVTANNDSLFHAMGYLKAEPMRKVRERCHWAAQDILDMSRALFQGNQGSAYAGRVTKAARTMNLSQLEQDVKSRRLLLPSCERRDQVDARGQDKDLALLAVAYGCSLVPVDIDSGYSDVHGYYADGKRYRYREPYPKPVAEMSGQKAEGPYMLINDGKYWRPLVTER